MAKKVYIDPGHGGHDPGAVDGKAGDGIYTEEEDLNLIVGLNVNAALKRCGFLTKMSRTTDSYPSLSARSGGANSWGADIFVSIHFNAASPSAKGVEILYNSGSTAGKTLSSKIFPYLAATTPWADRTVRADTRGLHVLRATNMPATLIECEFITNIEAEKLVTTKAWQLLAGEAIAQGICSYFGVKYIPNGSAVTPTKPIPTPAVRPVLDNGDNGSAVTTLQKMLLAIGYKLPKYGADGDFGDETEIAVEAFQRDQKITVDGIVGQDTWYKLDVAYAKAMAPAPPVVKPAQPNQDTATIIVSRGSKLDEVEALLKKNGVFGVSIYNLGVNPMLKALNPDALREGDVPVDPDKDVITIAINRETLLNEIDAGLTEDGIYGINVYNIDGGAPKSRPVNPNDWR